MQMPQSLKLVPFVSWLHKLKQFEDATSPKYVYVTCYIHIRYKYMGVSENGGTPKSSILIGFSIINHPIWGNTPIFGNPHIDLHIK